MKKIKGIKNNNTKNNCTESGINLTAGITIIALVVTIIVLLILAGVSIATLSGDNGILGQARKCKRTS